MVDINYRSADWLLAVVDVYFFLRSSTTRKDDVVVISSSSSDEDTDKGNEEDRPRPPSAKQELKQMTGQEEEARTVDNASRSLAASLELRPEPTKARPGGVPRKQSQHETQDQSTADEPRNATSARVATNSQSDSDSDEVISQEDLLAKLGLSSVKELSRKETGKASESSLPKTDGKPMFPHRPKESIIEMLKVPRIFEPKRGKKNGEAGAVLVNGVKNEDVQSDSADDSPGDDDDGMKSKEKLISRLQNELRNEEAKLLLLKKIQAAQNEGKLALPKSQKENMVARAPGPTVPQHGLKLTNQMTGKKSQTLPPPPPLKTSSGSTGASLNPQRILPKSSSQPTSTQSAVYSKFTISSPATASSDKSGSAIKNLQIVVSSMTNLIQPSPVYARSGPQGSSPLYTASSQSAPVRPTPVRASTHSAAGSSGYVSFPPHMSQSSHHAPSASSGKQAAAKMALRKQLERTLLQIPPPKPPPPEWSFIPSLNNPEFMGLVGLEQVVNGLTTKSSKAPLEEKAPENPKVCAQCASDFTPTWKERDGGVIVCERCSTLNVKKELKAEHTSRLKQAFLKALKQEQEIEQKMNDTPAIAPKPQTARSPSQPLSSHHHIAHHQPVLHHHHQSVQPRLYHHHQPVAAAAAAAAHSESLLFQLQQQHLQQQQQELEAARRQADARWHPYLPTHRHSSHKTQHHHPTYIADSDRQYLLDMIPSLPTNLGFGSSRL